MSKFEMRDDRELGIFFIHSALDDYGLDPCEFRIYCHIASAKELPDGAAVSDKCRIGLETVNDALDFLEKQGLISIDSSSITLNDSEDWKPCDRAKG